MCATSYSGTAALWDVISKGSLAGLATENHLRDLLEKQSKGKTEGEQSAKFCLLPQSHQISSDDKETQRLTPAP